MNEGRPPSTAWRTVRFGDVVRNVDEAVRDPLACDLERFVGLEHIDPESLRIKRWGLIADGTSFTRKFTAGQVLFGKRRAYQRKVAVADFDGLCSSDILVFEPADDRLLPELLPFIVQTEGFFQHALGTSAGSLSPRTRWRDLAAYEFPLPPLDEQGRIAEILWAAEEVIESLCVAQKAASDFRSRLLDEFLLQGLPEWHSLYSKTTLGRLPATWTVRPCEELLLEAPRNGFSPEINAEGVGRPTLSIAAVRDGQIVTEGNVKYAKVADTDIERFLLRPGDLLVVRGNGNKNLVARCGLVTQVPEGCFYPDLLIRLKFDPSLMRSQFACVEWNAPSVHSRLLTRAKSTNGIWKVNGKDLRQHTLAVPPIEEQDAFMSQLEPCARVVENVQRHLDRTRNLKKGLLDRLLPCRATEVAATHAKPASAG